jgi:ornithine carbamoyltransferase
MSIRHFLTLSDLSPGELEALIARAIELKAIRRRGEVFEPLKNRVLAMIFEKSSTRTRVSFEAGMAQMGGRAIFLAPDDLQLGRGEPVEDTARVVSRMVDALMIRTFAHQRLESFARYSAVPVINGLTDLFHPCQILADMQTYVEHRGSIRGKQVAWIGDGNNMCNSYMQAAQQFGFHLRIACPDAYRPDPDLLRSSADRISISRDPRQAAAGADLIVTDVWASMGQEHERTERLSAFDGFQIDDEILDLAKPDVIFMHCLPVHRGEEVSASVIDGPRSVVWDEAENRMHAQNALLEFLILKASPTRQ